MNLEFGKNEPHIKNKALTDKPPSCAYPSERVTGLANPPFPVALSVIVDIVDQLDLYCTPVPTGFVAAKAKKR